MPRCEAELEARRLVAVAYRDQATAQGAARTLSQLQHDRGIQLDDMAIAARDRAGTLTVRHPFGPAGADREGGAPWGRLIGLIFLAPVLAMAVDAPAVADGGTPSDAGADDRLMQDLAARTADRGAVLFALVRETTPGRVLQHLSTYGGEVLGGTSPPPAPRDPGRGSHGGRRETGLVHRSPGDAMHPAAPRPTRPAKDGRRLAPARPLPHWAIWPPSAAIRAWTVGVEEEAILLDAQTLCVANRSDEAVAMLPPAARARVSAETHACVLELQTGAHVTVGDAVAELRALRTHVAEALRNRMGLRVAAAGTHPLAMRSQVALAAGARYREIGATMRALALREPTMALHVHVATPDAEGAVRALDGLRADLPALLALSANSPYWRGVDSGFASMRTPIFSMFPRTGVPRRFGGYGRYVRAVDRLIRAGAIPEPGFVWWDVRLQPRFGTVEVRVMDAQSRIADVGALAAVVQCLVCHHAAREPAPATDPEVLAENRFLAARDGMGAQLIGDGTVRVPASDAVAGLLERCRPYALALGCAPELAAATDLAADPGHARQRRLAARHGVPALPALLSDEYAPAELAVGAP